MAENSGAAREFEFVFCRVRLRSQTLVAGENGAAARGHGVFGVRAGDMPRKNGAFVAEKSGSAANG
jgi:hypothetical protein